MRNWRVGGAPADISRFSCSSASREKCLSCFWSRRSKQTKQSPHPDPLQEYRERGSCVFESLENRRLFAGDPTAGVSLPFRLDFNRGGLGGVVDRDGTGTGFSYVQPNR